MGARIVRPALHPDPNIRVSHAERTEVADRLSKHYGDGRLDEEEFNERLDRAMKAKTRADLDGLFDDLPDSEGPSRPSAAPLSATDGAAAAPSQPAAADRVPRVRRDRRDHGGTGARRAVVRLPVPCGWPLGWGFHIPWLLIGLVVFLWYRFARRRP